MANLQTTIGGVQLPSCVFNAAVPRALTLEGLKGIGASESGAILIKTCTLEPREGNEEPRYWDNEECSINSMGLPNLGYREYVDFAAKLKTYDKPIIVSLAGMQPEEFPVLVREFDKSQADMIELNFSCPNIKGKPQIGYDFEQSDRILQEVVSLTSKPIGVKLPPYFDFVHFEQMAEVLAKHDIAFVATINSIGNALIIDPETERPVIRPKGGFGGLGGKVTKPTALANVRKFRQLLPSRISVIGVGGIYTGIDVFEFLLAGAGAVQVGTCFQQEGPACFGRIQKELSGVLDRKGYKTAKDAVSKLKEL